MESQFVSARYVNSATLTLEVDLLCLDLGVNVHRDLVKLELEALDLLSNVLNCASSRLVVHVLVLLSDHEVDLLGLSVELLPADLQVLLLRRLHTRLS